ncbi:MAG: ABC transporter [Planctomycetota bacterium]|nr:MAG: ABC transporter [Planctomycetota bacterium]
MISGLFAAYVLPITMLVEREFVRFFRQRSRVVGALAQPVIFWVLFGAGLRGAFQMKSANGGDVSFQEYFLPGAALMIVLFTSIFSSISVIQDRNEGFLQGVLASPVPRLSLVLGKLCGGALLALTQAMLFLWSAPLLQYVGLAPEMPMGFSGVQSLAMMGVLFLTGMGMAGLGFLFAWKIDSVQGFHGVMSVLLMPMWLLSGAFFPPSGSRWLSWVVSVNPLSYGLSALRHVIGQGVTDSLPSLPVSLLVSSLFAASCVSLGVWMTRRPTGA